MNQSRCFDCKYFSPEGCIASVEELTKDDWDESMLGECRRHAPRVGQYLGEDALVNGYDYGQWPLVQAANWCGEFVACERAEAHLASQEE